MNDMFWPEEIDEDGERGCLPINPDEMGYLPMENIDDE